jgi:hypothetical protein
MPADLEPLRRSVVRILTEDEHFVGLGLRIADDVVVTCAHVVSEALEIDSCVETPPKGRVRINAPATVPGPSDLGYAAVLAGGWFPKRNSKRADEPADIAVLHLERPSQDSVVWATVSTLLSLSGIRCKLLGAPEGHTQDLVPLTATVGEATESGRYLLEQTTTGYRIGPGCSGSPVADVETGKIVGLVVQDELESRTAIAFMISAAELRACLKKLGLPSQFQSAPPLGVLRDWVRDRVTDNDRTLGRRCTRFIDSYSAEGDNPLPFVGRQYELECLQDWLGSGGVFSLTSPAGRGKSALLLHFASHTLSERPNFTLLFVPISIRFETADELSGLRLLYLELSSLFGQLRFGDSAHPDLRDYRESIQNGWEFIANYTNGCFLLIVDGADEAAGRWIEHEVLPYELPGNLSVIVAERTAGDNAKVPNWLASLRTRGSHYTRVHAQTSGLTLLSKEAVREAVAQLGHPFNEMVEEKALTEELYRLTDQGDPLLLSLWVNQLWRTRDQMRLRTADQLRRLEPGIGGFMDLWFEEQERLWRLNGLHLTKVEVEPLLYLVALAQGPLTVADISSLAALYRLPEELELKKNLRHVLESASRLLVPSGDAEGFSLVHPRLAFHYLHALAQHEGELRRLSRTFIEWGRTTIEHLDSGEVSPGSCPRYLLRHYTSHVLDMLNQDITAQEALDRYLLPLVSRPGWHLSWREEEGAYGGFLVDVSRVEGVLDPESSPGYFGVAMRCLLCRSSVGSVVSNVPVSLFPALVRSGFWSVGRTARFIENLADVSMQFEALLAIVRVHTATEDRTRLLEQTLRAAQSIQEEWSRADALARLTGQLEGQPQLIEQVLQSVLAIQYPYGRARALAAVAQWLEEHRKREVLEQALQAAQAIQYEGSRADALADLTGQLEGQPELIDQVLRAAQAIQDGDARARALAAVAEKLDGEPRREMFQDALQFAQAIQNESSRAGALVAVGERLGGQPELIDEILQSVRGIQDKASRARTLVALAEQVQGQQKRDVVEQALQAAQAVQEEWSRADALAAVAGQLATQPQLIEHVLKSVQAIQYGGARARALAAVAQWLEGQRKYEVLEQALWDVQGVREDWSRWPALEAVAAQVTDHVKLVERVLGIAQAIRDQDSRAWTLVAAAEQLEGQSKHDLIEQALQAVRAIQHEEPGGRVRDLLLEQVAKQLAGQPQWIEEALRTAKAIQDVWARASALEAVAKQLERQQPQLIEQVLQSAQAIQYGYGRTRVLAAVAQCLEEHRKHEVLEQALEVAQAIQYEGSRADALAVLTEQLAEQPQLTEPVMHAAQAIQDERSRVKVLIKVAGQLAGQPQLTEKVLLAAQALRDEAFRAQALVAVAEQLEGQPKRKVIEQALEAAQVVPDEALRAQALVAVAEQLEGQPKRKVVEQALEAAQAIQYDGSRADALVLVAGQAKGQARRVLEQALQAAWAIQDVAFRADALVRIAGQADGQLKRSVLEQALQAARVIQDEGSRSDILAKMAIQLAGQPQLLERALQASLVIVDGTSRLRALVAVAAQLEGHAKQQALEQALQVTQAITHQKLLAEALVEIATRLPGLGGVERAVTLRMIHMARSLPRPCALKVVRALLPALRAFGGTSAIMATAEAIVSTGEWWP